MTWINPFTPKSGQFQIFLQPHQKYQITHYEERAFSWLNSDERWLYWTNSHYLTHTFLFEGWENVLFELTPTPKLLIFEKQRNRQRLYPWKLTLNLVWSKLGHLTSCSGDISKEDGATLPNQTLARHSVEREEMLLLFLLIFRINKPNHELNSGGKAFAIHWCT